MSSCKFLQTMFGQRRVEWALDNYLFLVVINPNVAKAGGIQSQEEPRSKIKIEASSRKAGASEGEVVVLYFEPSATQDLKSSGFHEG